MAFAEKLRRLMERAGLNQKGVAELTNTSRAAVSQYLSGRHEPSRARKRQMAAALGVKEDYFQDFLAAPEIRPCANLPVALAARLMGKSQAWVAKGLQDGVFPWGYAVKLERWSYFISPSKFAEHTGIKVPCQGEEGAA